MLPLGVLVDPPAGADGFTDHGERDQRAGTGEGQGGPLIQSITREPIKERLGVHLSQIIVRIYLGKIRDALGLPGYVEQAVERINKVDREDAAGAPIEGRSALKRLSWLSRVRKVIQLERMGGVFVPM